MAKFSSRCPAAQADHLKANMATLSAAKIVYSAGFFITVSPESMETLYSGKVVVENGGVATGGAWAGSRISRKLASAS